MAAGHYQFEAIHPFTDGNGRTGRVINSLFLIQEDLLTPPILYLSRYIIRHKEQYYGLLVDVTRNESWEPWLLFILDGVRETAATYLKRLAEMGLLEERRSGREKLFVNLEMLEILVRED